MSHNTERLIKLCPGFYICSNVKIQSFSLEESEFENEDTDTNSKKMIKYQIVVTLNKKNEQGIYESMYLTPTADSPQILYEQLQMLATQLDFLKISPSLYIAKDLNVESIHITEYCGDYPKISNRHIIIATLSNRAQFWLGNFENYQSALSYLDNIFI
jgi:hypothetical protein